MNANERVEKICEQIIQLHLVTIPPHPESAYAEALQELFEVCHAHGISDDDVTTAVKLSEKNLRQQAKEMSDHADVLEAHGKRQESRSVIEFAARHA